MPRTVTKGAPLPGASSPGCPKCGGPMWDNRETKRNAKAPDFRCRNRECGGAIWPGQQSGAFQLFAPTPAAESRQPVPIGDIVRHQAKSSLCKCYLDVTDFVLSKVRGKYQAAGVTCSDATMAAIAATLFISACGRNGNGNGGGR